MQHLLSFGFFPDHAACSWSRDRALLLVRTSLVLVIDGDLLVQSALRAKLATAGPDWARMLSEAQVNFRHGGFA